MTPLPIRLRAGDELHRALGPIRWLLGGLLLFLALGTRVASATESPADIPEGRGSFIFTDSKGDPSRPLKVYTYLPSGVDPATAPIVFVMHGVRKNADAYRDVWIEHADHYHFIVVAPRFDAVQWGAGAYSYASVVDRDGVIQDPSRWSFSVIEHLFDAIRMTLRNTTPQYFLYGHSEGAQFVHRLVLLLPDARYARAVAANAGWYTMPSTEVGFPYGLAGSPITDASLKRSLGRELVVMLGDRDTDPNHPELNQGPRAMAQGTNRYDRGHAFFRQAEARAKDLGATFAWRLQIVRGAAHQNRRMSGPAAAVLMAP